MSWRDRNYSGDEFEGGMRLGFARPSSMVTWLLIANVAVFFIDVVFTRTGLAIGRYAGLSLHGIQSFYFWQPLTYMFMHADVLHLLFNMLGLYVFGSEFERSFGQQRFLQFYATCGLVGGLAYLVLGAFSPFYANVPLVGASGGVFGLLVAAVIFFPHIQVVLFIFPMPVRVFALIWAAFMLLQILSGEGVGNPGGQVCHAAGAATGLGLFYAWGMLPGGKGRGLPGFGRHGVRRGAWARRQKRLADEQAEVDRILDKVRQHGIQSLGWKERRALSRATQRQRQRDREFDRVDRL